ncbi:MAG: SpoVG family protein [Candidatus Omnitrophota bacterium]
MSIEIKVNRMHKLGNAEKNMKAFADIEINGILLIKGLRILNGKNGLFISMPRLKGNNSQWYETVRALTKETKQKIVSAVLAAYEKVEE